MKKYNHIIFDLDGTLTDSKPGIINAALYAVDKMGFEDRKQHLLDQYIGLPLQEYFETVYQSNNEMTEMLVMHFRDYYGKKGVYENKVYEGIPELLQQLKSKGRHLYISTAKYEKYAKVVSDHFGFTTLLADLIGADAKGLHATKSGLAAQIIERNQIRNLDEVVVVGDKHMDVQAGYDNGTDSIGVTYGFGLYDEIKASSPTYIVDNVDELAQLLV
jgi:phosphoglycolate phosphatase